MLKSKLVINDSSNDDCIGRHTTWFRVGIMYDFIYGMHVYTFTPMQLLEYLDSVTSRAIKTK